MISSPNSYHPYPAYNSGYGTVPPAQSPYSPKPGYASPGFPAPSGQTAPSGTTLPSAIPPAPNALPAAPTPPYPHHGPSFWNHFLPSFPTFPTVPQQPMTISLNTPKLSSDEMKKKFLFTAAAGTVSMVTGLLIVSFFGLKILPQRIAAEMGIQSHKSMLRTLDQHSIANLLGRIKERVLTSNTQKADQLHKKWAQEDAEKLHANKSKREQFLKDISPHVSISDLAALFSQQVLRKTFSPQYIQEQSHTFSDALLSETAKQDLLRKMSAHPEIKEILKAHDVLKSDGTIEALKPAKLKEIMPEIYKRASISDSVGVAVAEATQTALKNSFANEANLSQALKAPSIQKKAGELNQNLSKMKAEEQLRFVQQHITIQDAVNLITDNASRNALNNTVPEIITPDNVKTALETPTVKAALGKGKTFESKQAELKFVRENISIQDALALLAKHMISQASFKNFFWR
jgi:hypothetical protein